ncbi:MAG: TRAP transporter small permease [Burkholderiaceae bacterium]
MSERPGAGTTAVRLAGALRRLNRQLAVVAGAALLAMMLIGALDVLASNLDLLGLTSRPVPSAREAVATLMVAAVFLAMARAQQQDAHIRVTLGALASRRGGRALEALRHGWHAAFFALIAGFGWQRAFAALATGEFAPGLIDFPLWPARFALAIGATAMSVQCLLDIAAVVDSRLRPTQGERA